MTDFQKIWNETMGCGACEQQPSLKDRLEKEYLVESLTEDLQKLYAENEELHKKLEQQPRWIPVSERLPEEFEDVLVTDVSEDILVAYLNYEHKWVCYTEFGINVVAWMPLPEPYKEDKE